jgi:uncharacterized membrane protein YtjA (UPF0391 family)
MGLLGWAFTFLAIALLAALFGFGGIAVAFAGIAKILFFIFLVVFIALVLMNLFQSASLRGNRLDRK